MIECWLCNDNLWNKKINISCIEIFLAVVESKAHQSHSRKCLSAVPLHYVVQNYLRRMWICKCPEVNWLCVKSRKKKKKKQASLTYISIAFNRKQKINKLTEPNVKPYAETESSSRVEHILLLFSYWPSNATLLLSRLLRVSHSACKEQNGTVTRIFFFSVIFQSINCLPSTHLPNSLQTSSTATTECSDSRRKKKVRYTRKKANTQLSSIVCLILK